MRLSDYARERLGVSARSVQSAVWVATRLEALPAVSRAFTRAEVTWTQVRLLCGVASTVDEHRWLTRASLGSVEDLQRAARTAAPARVPPDPEGADDEIDGEPRLRLRIACPARVRALWRHALELASRMTGGPLADWQAAEVIAAEGFSGRPPGVALADRAVLACLRLARQAKRLRAIGRASNDAAGAPPSIPPTTLARPVHHVEEQPNDGPGDGHAGDALLPLRSTAVDAPVTSDPFAVDACLVATMGTIRTTEPRIGQLLRLVVDHRLYRFLGFRSLDGYVRERLGISTRKAWALLKLEQATWRSGEFARAYHRGDLSWARASALLPVLDRSNAAAWIGRARAVTVRRLADEVSWVLEQRDAFGGDVLLVPLPPDSRLPSPVAAMLRNARCRDLSLVDDVQIGAQADLCDVEVAFSAPASVVALCRDVLDAFARPGMPRWSALEALLGHVVGYWEGMPRHRDPIFQRDGWRCSVPACTSRRGLHDHHVRFRSRGGGNERENRVAVCPAHHLHGIHAGTVQATGSAPHDIYWQLGVRSAGPPLLACVGDRLCEPHAPHDPQRSG